MSAPMPRGGALLVLLLLSAAAPAAQSARACPGGLVVTRAEIEAAGLVYLSDLYRLLPLLRRTTIDGFTWQPFDGTGVPFAEPLPLVLVDGVPADLDFLGETDLELLPVPLPEIERVAYCPASEPVAGVWAGRGTLRIETRRREAGLTSRGSWQIGNETGDPGPFRYTERETPNVDKSGPDVEGAFGYEAERLGGGLRFRILRVYATDPAINRRTSAATTRGSRSARVVTASAGGHVGRASRHAAALVGRYVSDFAFREVAGRELPLRRFDVHADALGPAAAGLRYRLAAHVQGAADEDSELEAFDLDWRRRTLTAALYGAPPATTPGLRYGASLVRTDASSGGWDDGFTLGTAYGDYTYGQDAVTGRTALALTATDDALGAKATQTFGLERASRGLRLTLALDRRLPEEAPGYGLWRARGFTGLELPAVTYRAAPPAPQTEASARLSGWLDVAAARVEGGAHAWAGRGLFVERPAFGLAGDGTTAGGTVTAVPDAEGGAFGAWVQATAGRGRWHGTAWYSLLAPFGGGDAFRAAWDRIPRHRVGAAVTLRPDPGLAVRATFEAQSATRWPGYAAVAGATIGAGARDYVYTDGTPAFALLDLAVDKALWERRARVSLLFRNLFNAEERYHPLGAALDFRLYARLAVQLRGPLWVGPRGGD